jgi:NhaA family Na+:H+ antiporter
LTALAIIDDLGSIMVIAIFYTDQLSWLSLEVAAVALAALVTLNRADVQRVVWYVLVGVVLWVFVLKSGAHATLAGVVWRYGSRSGRPPAQSRRSCASSMSWRRG